MRIDTTPTTPPWEQALTEQVGAARLLAWTIHHAHTHVSKFPYNHNLIAEWQTDLLRVRAAETYAWYGDALTACQQAAPTIPNDSQLIAPLIPGIGQGWWWFKDPLPIPTTRDGTVGVRAILWGLTQYRHAPEDRNALTEIRLAADPSRWRNRPDDPNNPDKWCVLITAFCDDDLTRYPEVDRPHGPIPSTMFRWPLGRDLIGMLDDMRANYRVVYGKGGKYEGAPTTGEEPVAHACLQLAQFFLAGCAWLQQEILHEVHGHIERHARKRAVREGSLRDCTGVKVIALRHARIVRDEGSEPVTREGHSPTCQFVVSGHWRNQPHGPGRTERRLIYINPFIKGPEGAPLKARSTVYAVVR